MIPDRWRTPFWISVFAVGFEILLTAFLAFSAPAGTRWLGDTIGYPSDTPVYLSELHQGESHILLANLYAIEPHARRFDPFWSTLGQLTRPHLPPLVLYESARYAMTFVLVFALYAVAKSVSRTEEEARIGTLLSVLGIGTGWIYTVILGALHLWSPTLYGAPDIASEFSIATILFGSPHIILSTALLLLSLLQISPAFEQTSKKSAWLATLSSAALFSFHPYFVPLVGIFVALSAIVHFRTKTLRETVSFCAIFSLSLVPALLIYLPLAFDPVFRTHHLEVNRLPLMPWYAWFATLFPFLVASAWRWKRHIRIAQRETWLVLWIVSMVFAAFFPVPWTEKFTEGLLVAFVLLSLPAWIALRDALRMLPTPHWSKQLTIGAILLIAALSPANLLASQIQWATTPGRLEHFYRSSDLFDAWTFLQQTTDHHAVVTSDDAWVDLWTPAYAERTTWVAHDHETPSYRAKRAQWNELMHSQDPIRVRDILHMGTITDLIATSDASRARFQSLLDASWNISFSKGTITIFHRSPVQTISASIE